MVKTADVYELLVFDFLHLIPKFKIPKGVSSL